jgi:hypothetical protein
VNDALEHGSSCTLLTVDGGRVAPNQGRPVRLFGFGPKRVFGTERVTVISLAALFPGSGRFKASPAEGTFEHLTLLYLCPGDFADGISPRSALASVV